MLGKFGDGGEGKVKYKAINADRNREAKKKKKERGSNGNINCLRDVTKDKLSGAARYKGRLRVDARGSKAKQRTRWIDSQIKRGRAREVDSLKDKERENEIDR